MTLMTLQPVLPVENISSQKSPTGITGRSVISVMEAFPIGCGVHVKAAPVQLSQCSTVTDIYASFSKCDLPLFWRVQNRPARRIFTGKLSTSPCSHKSRLFLSLHSLQEEIPLIKTEDRPARDRTSGQEMRWAGILARATLRSQ
jgi:hypothetical protein